MNFEYSALNGGIYVSPSPKVSGTILEEGVRRTQGPENGEDCGEILASEYDMAVLSLGTPGSCGYSNQQDQPVFHQTALTGLSVLQKEGQTRKGGRWEGDKLYPVFYFNLLKVSLSCPGWP